MTWQVEVTEVIDETAEARSLVLRVPDHLAPEFSYRPGQFLTVQVPHPQAGPDGSVARCYSLSSSPDADELLKITVKRVPGGHASNWICDHVSAGSTLRVLPPAGLFTPRRLDQDVLLVAGGSGITPVLSILKTLLARGRGRASLVYANRDQAAVIFAQDLKVLQARYPTRLQIALWLDSEHGPPTVRGLQNLAADVLTRAELTAPDVFLCGPAAFMDAATEAVHGLGVPAGRVHVERFESLTENPFAVGDLDADAVELAGHPGGAPSGDPTGVTERGTTADRDTGIGTGGGRQGDMDADRDGATTAGTDAGPDSDPGTARPAVALEVTRNGHVHQLTWPPQTRLLDVLIAAGLNPPYSCRQGQCGACACRITAGKVELVHNEVLEEEDFADNYILACQALPRTESIDVTYD